jgi:hypothetical protein
LKYEREREREREGENFIQFYSFDIIVMAQTFMRGCCFLMAFVGLDTTKARILCLDSL